MVAFASVSLAMAIEQVSTQADTALLIQQVNLPIDVVCFVCTYKCAYVFACSCVQISVRLLECLLMQVATNDQELNTVVDTDLAYGVLQRTAARWNNPSTNNVKALWGQKDGHRHNYLVRLLYNFCCPIVFQVSNFH